MWRRQMSHNRYSWFFIIVFALQIVTSLPSRYVDIVRRYLQSRSHHFCITNYYVVTLKICKCYPKVFTLKKLWMHRVSIESTWALKIDPLHGHYTPIYMDKVTYTFVRNYICTLELYTHELGCGATTASKLAWTRAWRRVTSSAGARRRRPRRRGGEQVRPCGPITT